MEASTKTKAVKTKSPYITAIEDERNRLVVEVQNGNEKAKNDLMTSLLPYINKIVSMYSGYNLDQDDLRNEAYVSATKCMYMFDTTRGKPFTAYVGRAIHRTFWKYIAKETKYDKKNKTVVEVPMGDYLDSYMADTYSDGDDYEGYAAPMEPLETYIPYREENTISEHQSDFIEEMLSTLNPRERYIIEHIFGIDKKEEMNLTELAQVYQLSIERVRKIRDAAIKKMRCHALRIATK